MTPRITVGITTRNRPESLRRCLESLGRIAHLAPEVLVFDDGSNPPAATPAGITTILEVSSPGIGSSLAGLRRLNR